MCWNFKVYRLIAILFVLLAAYTIGVLYISDGSSRHVIFRSDQPSNLHYGSFDPYYLSIRNGPTQWKTTGWPSSKYIEVFKKADPDGYGHSVELAITGGEEISRADWSQSGISLRFTSGHVLFIPKSAFIGGR